MTCIMLYKTLRKKYQINESAWSRIKLIFKCAFIGLPFMNSVLVFICWALTDNSSLGILHRFSWISVIIILLSCFLLKTIIFHRFFLFRSKYTIILAFEVLLYITMFFIFISSACAFRFLGTLGLTIQSFSFLIAFILICSHYYDYWNKIWKKHEKYNETEALDLEHGRFYSAQ
jgi:phosphatidylserine synthase